MNSAGDDIRLRMPGCPIRKSPDQSLLGGSPKLIAASHVLHRLLAPRHPPRALSSLTTKGRESHPSLFMTTLLKIPYYSVVKDQIGSHSRVNAETRAANLAALITQLAAGCRWWSGPGLNRQPPACKADALPIELPPRGPPSSRRASACSQYPLAFETAPKVDGGPR
jgi:hypothetical protein